MPTSLTKRPVLLLPLSSTEKILEVIAGIGILMVLVILLFYRPLLPDSIPSHFDIAGAPDAWGNKGLLSAIVAIPVAVYLAMTLLGRFPQIYNYPFALTEENVQQQYRCARFLMLALKAEMVWFFAYLEWRIIETAFGKGQGLSPVLFPTLLVCTLSTAAIYFYRAYRLR